jgi:hypothetical protein
MRPESIPRREGVSKSEKAHHPSSELESGAVLQRYPHLTTRNILCDGRCESESFAGEASLKRSSGCSLRRQSVDQALGGSG